MVEVSRGPAAAVIVDAASRHHADLIVVGSRGLHGLGEFFLGSTSHSVLHLSRTTVAIIPAHAAVPAADATQLAGATAK